jgi:branched-chain amino acid transport system permease protein
VVAEEPWRDYRIGILSGARGVLPKVLDEPVFASEQDALHGVFLARIRDLRES